LLSLDHPVSPRQHIGWNPDDFGFSILDFRSPYSSPFTPYRITRSALAKTFGGIVKPICLAGCLDHCAPLSIIELVMGKTAEELDQLLNLVKDEDIATLRALDRQLHSLLEEKERDEAKQRQGKADRDVITKQCPNVPIDPELFNLVGIHPESPVQDDKVLIREFIVRRIVD
jgi:hypothetical protein